MRITAAEIHDFKRVKDVTINPPADASIILIGGKNAQGKSSILDALTAALGGGRAAPVEPIRRGAKSAEITIEFDGGKLVVQRIINKTGSHLEVRNAEGEIVKSPQAMLDKLVGARFLDPLAFKALPAKEQRAQLMKLIPDAARIEKLDASRATAFSRRTEIGRDQAKAQGELNRLKATSIAEGTAIDVAALTAEKATFAETQRAGDGLGNVCALRARETKATQQLFDSAKSRFERLQVELAEAEKEAANYNNRLGLALVAEAAANEKLVAAASAWSASAERRAELDAQLAKADVHNRAVFEAAAHRKRLEETQTEAKRLDDDYDACSKAIVTCDERKAAILAAAKLPVPGLTVVDDGIELNGVPFAQASGAEQLRVSVALALAASPNLDDVWVRDAALLDTEHLALVAEMAAAAGKRVWLERVGTADPGVIVIADGQVAS